MSLSRKPAAVLFAALACTAALALSRRPLSQDQSAPQPGTPVARNVIVLDPAHGGPDAGAKLGDNTVEKDVTLALALRLRTALQAEGFTVIMTRDSDPAALLTTDQRADVANRYRAAACLVLHATTTGTGVHLYTSELSPNQAVEETSSADDEKDGTTFFPTPWETAQASFVPQSLRLAGDLASALHTDGLPVLTDRAAVLPLDNLMCPAVAVELAPGGDATPVTDTDYQQRVATALAHSLQGWRAH